MKALLISICKVHMIVALKFKGHLVFVFCLSTMREFLTGLIGI